jgi:hypothetical protein
MSFQYLNYFFIYRVQSPIDGRSFTGISSIRVMQPRDFKGEGHRLLRWTELFVIQMEDSARSSSNRIEDNGDITRFAETLAKAASVALAAKLASLEPHTLIGLRVSLDGDSVNWIIHFFFKSRMIQHFLLV